ncbi:cell division protein SepF [Pilimelia columellifera]|uniref:Cell division protein SepF n=1 Tax=Pilimelia columellifera subsp. columellifera TaxID=706583 RepID=A0ABP6AJR8_9ACTN
MSTLRKAGVWLGLIEDDDDRGYGERGYTEPAYRESGYRSSRYAEEFTDEDEDELDEPPVPRARSERLDPVRADRAERTASVRSITRPAPSTGNGYPSRDNVALAPQPTPRERASVAEDDERRYQITTLHPTTYNEARTIGEHFRDGTPVIMNLTEMDEADAKRLVDFAAGLAFGLRGTIERVTNRVFLLSPANVQVTAEDKAKIAEGGFFNQN